MISNCKKRGNRFLFIKSIIHIKLNMKTIQINGVEYIQKRNRVHLFTFMTFLKMRVFDYFNIGVEEDKGGSAKKLLKEYRLIMRDKSKFSDIEKNWITYQFDSNFLRKTKSVKLR